MNNFSYEIIKVNLNTINGRDGEGIIQLDANSALSNISQLNYKIESLCEILSLNSICIELPSWKIVGQYSPVESDIEDK